jgi:hypothetical protein
LSAFLTTILTIFTPPGNSRVRFSLSGDQSPADELTKKCRQFAGMLPDFAAMALADDYLSDSRTPLRGPA